MFLALSCAALLASSMRALNFSFIPGGRPGLVWDAGAASLPPESSLEARAGLQLMATAADINSPSTSNLFMIFSPPVFRLSAACCAIRTVERIEAVMVQPAHIRLKERSKV